MERGGAWSIPRLQATGWHDAVCRSDGLPLPHVAGDPLQLHVSDLPGRQRSDCARTSRASKRARLLRTPILIRIPSGLVLVLQRLAEKA